MTVQLILFMTFTVLGAGGEPAVLINVYTSACHTSDSRAVVTQAAGLVSSPDMKELQEYNLTVEQFDIDTVSTIMLSACVLQKTKAYSLRM